MQRPGGDTLAGMAEQGGHAGRCRRFAGSSLRRIFSDFHLDADFDHLMARQTAEDGIADGGTCRQQHAPTSISHRLGDKHAGSKFG